MQMHLERLGCFYLHEAAAVAACAFGGGDLSYRLREARTSSTTNTISSAHAAKAAAAFFFLLRWVISLRRGTQAAAAWI